MLSQLARQLEGWAHGARWQVDEGLKDVLSLLHDRVIEERYGASNAAL